MFISQENLVIRSATPADAQTLCDWWNDGSVMVHVGYPNGLGTTPQAVLNDLNTWKAGSDLLILEIDKVPVGEMNYQTVNDGVAEIHIKICRGDFQDKGYGTRFTKMLIRHLFSELGFRKIILDTNLKNTRAQHVYEQMGFKRVRVNIDVWKDQLGVPQTSIYYELTREDFRSQNGEPSVD